MEKKEGKKILLLFIQEELVNGLVYNQTKEGLELVGLGQEQTWDGKNYASLKGAVEKSLSGHLESKEEKSIDRTFFVVSPFWTIDAQKLMESKSELLKNLCREYHWPPGGFVIDDESLVFHFKAQEEVPPSFISLLLLDKGFRLSLVHLGKVKKRLKLSSSNVSAQSVREGLDQLAFEGVLPPKFVIWGKINPELEEQMLSYQWVDKKGDLFLHLPDVQLLDWPQLGKIFKEIVASQLEEIKESEVRKEGREVVDKEEKEEEERSTLPVGFSFDDLSQKGKKEEKEGEGIKEIKEEGIPEENLAVKVEEAMVEGKKVKSPRKLPFTKIFLKAKSVFKKFSFKGRKGLGGWVIRGGILIFVAVVAYGLFGLEREVVLYLTPEEIETKTEVLLAEGKAQGEKVLPVVELSVEESAEGQEVATGTSLIGEKAGGKVTIYNRTSDSVSFAQGAKIIGPSKLGFILLEEANIASKTPDLVSGVDRWGEKEVGVEAVGIGSEYNLGGETVFTIEEENQGDYLVKNKDSFSGGTSREVNAVSEEDLSRLREDLTSKLQDKVEKELTKKAKNGQQLVSETVSVGTVSFSTSKEAGEEGEDFTGELVLKATGLVIRQEDLAAFAKVELADQAPADYQLDEEGVEIGFVPVEEGDEGWLGKITVKGKFYPQPDTSSLASSLKGKQISKLLEIVKKQPRVYRYELRTSFSPLSFFPILPLKEDKIKISIEK